MENLSKKSQKKSFYIGMGKHKKGLLCMVTFFVFVISFWVTACGVSNCGGGIVTDWDKNYFKSDAYSVNLANTVGAVVSRIYDISNTPSVFSVSYVEEGVIHEYSAGVVNYYCADGVEFWDDFLANEEDLVESTKKSDSSRFYQLELLEKYLNSRLSENNYIYYSQSAFEKLFEKNGLQNEKNRYSDEFSENAYFIFECDASMMEILKGTENIRNSIKNLTYAVYDPESNLYYSTEDAYFEPMEAYIYDATELKYMIEDGAGNGNLSLIFTLLRMENLYHLTMWDGVLCNYDIGVAGLEELNMLEKSAFRYYFVSPDYEQGNVKDIDEIINLPYAYKATAEEVEYIGKVKMVNDMSENIQMEISDTIRECSKDAVIYFGIDESMISDADASYVIANMSQYETYTVASKISLITAILSFILLIWQACMMIRLTGKEKLEDTTIRLNQYDRLFTELWIVINVAIIVGCMGMFLVIASEIFTPDDPFTYVVVAGAALPFGFFFMILTLSFARRIKVHNLWNGSLLYRLFCVVTGKPIVKENREEQRNIEKGKFAELLDVCKERFARLKGTAKLLVIFVLYVLVSWILCDTAIGCGGDEPYFFFILLQIIAVVVVIWIIKDIDKLIDGVKEITEGNLDAKVTIDEKISVFSELADGINHIGDGLKNAVETSIKDERMKTELITNVSHDLKTPLTSIINYIDLLKKENMPTEDAKHYIEVLDAKSQRLKQLTEDLVEAAKATSGNIEMEMMPITFDELMKQALGEFEDKFEKKNLTIVATYPGVPAVIIADGRRLYRIIENVLQNIYKYAMEGTRVYADLAKDEGMVTFTLKNISASPLNISPEELMERFTRGDSSRTTEGSGLGLSIAKELTRLQNGTFEIQLDGDLFKVIIKFPQHIVGK